MIKTVRIILAVAGATAATASALAPGAASATVVCTVAHAPSPAAITKSATGVGATAATLVASVNPNGCSTTYHFDYGPTATYGKTTAATAAGSGTSFVSATAPITGLTPGTAYHFKIVATSVGGTTSGADGTFTTKPGCVAGVAPSVVTTAATGIEPSAATAHGELNPHGCSTKYHFEYGTTTGYGKMTSMQSGGSGTTPTPVHTALLALTPNTQYHFRLVATSAGGTTTGADMTFQTKAGCVRGITPPSVTTQPAVSITGTTAILRGAVGPNDCTTKYYFRYGLTTAYGSITHPNVAGSGTGSVPASASITGLQPGTTYHFRLIATSSGGKQLGSDMAFQTPAPTSAMVRVISRRPSVLTGYVAAIHLHCTLGASGCSGLVKLFHNHRFLGQRQYTMSAGTSTTVSVFLNGRGRKLVRHHERLRHVEVVAHNTANKARRFVTLVRRFQP